MADVGDAGQCLAAEPVGAHPFQVLVFAQLARRVPRAQERQIGPIDTMPVVGDLDELQTALFDREFDGRRAGIE
jgi:hypothetical protein